MVTKRARKWFARGTLIAVLLVGGILVGASWAMAGRIASRLLVVPPRATPVSIVGISGGEMVLQRTDETVKPGRWGIGDESGYAQLGEITASDAATVTRRILRVDGLPGESAVFDANAFAGDPSARGVAFEEVLFPGPVGDMAAWTMKGTDDTWVVFVHDAGADRTQALRIVPLVNRLGMSMIVPELRTAGPNATRTDLGEREWHDVEAAVDFALEAGAEDVVIVAHGTGASVALRYVAEARMADRVIGMVFDGALADPEGEAEARLRAENVPGFVVGWAKALAGFRFGMDWTLLDHVSRAGEHGFPFLLFHGDEDAISPPEGAREFAEAAVDAHFVLVPGAGHDESWNIDPLAYESELGAFLEQVGAGPTGLEPLNG